MYNNTVMGALESDRRVLYEYLLDQAGRPVHNKVELATLCATAAHRGATRRHSDEPYICHPARVANEVRTWLGQAGYIVGILHDTLEDAPTLTDIVESIAGPCLFRSLLTLTHAPDQPYDEYIRKIVASRDEFAICVKRADMKDNWRTATDSQKDKYESVMVRLGLRVSPSNPTELVPL